VLKRKLLHTGCPETNTKHFQEYFLDESKMKFLNHEKACDISFSHKLFLKMGNMATFGALKQESHMHAHAHTDMCQWWFLNLQPYTFHIYHSNMQMCHQADSVIILMLIFPTY
jgi:hypothetical protein